jgi:hypothetical protein
MGQAAQYLVANAVLRPNMAPRFRGGDDLREGRRSFSAAC